MTRNLWTLDARLKDSEQKTEKLFKIVQTKENIELGISKLSDTTYKTNFGIPSSSTNKVPSRVSGREDMHPIRFQPDIRTNTLYTYSDSNPVSINSSLHITSQQPSDRPHQHH